MEMVPIPNDARPPGINVTPGFVTRPIQTGPVASSFGAASSAAATSSGVPVGNEVQHQTANESGGASTPWTPTPQSTDYGGLAWTAFELPTGDTGYWAAAPGGGYYYYGPDQVLYHDTYSGEVHAGDLANRVGSVASFFKTSTPGSPPPGGGTGSGGGSNTGGNSGGAGLAGDGPLIDALTAMLGNAGMQNPLDAASSPSTAALDALQPTTGTTSSSGNPALIVLVVGAIAAAALWFYFKHKKKGAPQNSGVPAVNPPQAL